MTGTACGCSGTAACSCGCCEGLCVSIPRSLVNPPGQDRLSYRIGRHPDFLATMIARLTSHRLEDGTRPLQRLTTRRQDDPAIALLDAWATVADVLTFYQERIANEGYLMTATERRSVLELARLVGYRLRPGVAASVYLAFTLDDGFEVEIQSGTLARSVPEPGETAESFETVEPLEARSAWNALVPRMIRPARIVPEMGFSGTRTLPSEGVGTGLAVGDALLLTQGGQFFPYVVRAVEPDAVADRTTVHFADKMARHVEVARRTADDGPVSADSLASLSKVVEGLRRPPSSQPASRLALARDVRQTYGRSGDFAPQLLATFHPALRETLFAAYANAPVIETQESEQIRVEAMRVTAAPFGSTAPLELVFDDNVMVGRREWVLVESRSVLTIGAAADSDFSGTLFEAFQQDDLDVGQAAAIVLDIGVSDDVAEVKHRHLHLRDLQEVGNEDGRTFALDLAPELEALVEAVYREPDSSGGRRMEAIRITFRAGDRERVVRVFPESSAIGIASELSHQIIGIEISDIGYRFHPGEDQIVEIDDGRQLAVSYADDASRLDATLRERDFAAAGTAGRLLSLDGLHQGIVPGSRAIVDRPGEPLTVFTVQDVRTVARNDYGLAQKVTTLLLDRPWLRRGDRTLASLRPVVVHAQSEDLPIGTEPIVEDVAGDEIELEGITDGLEAGRWLMVTGERTDVTGAGAAVVPGIIGRELVMLAGISHQLAGTEPEAGQAPVPVAEERLHTRLLFAEGLAYRYRRDTVTINANVVRATHGETVGETLGSANGAKPFQTFALSRAPLTHVSASTPEGSATTLEVRINGVRWPEVETVLQLGFRDRGCETFTGDDQETTVAFGNGRSGTIPPAGEGNVEATYRVGIGLPGNVHAGQISTLGSRPLGVKEVINPDHATGGADAESRDQAREAVPTALQTLDRLVSVEDYAHFCLRFSGIVKAQAVRLSDGDRQLVHLTLAAAADAPVDERSDLFRNLTTALASAGDRSRVVRIAPREAAFILLNAEVKVHPDHRWDVVEPAIRRALLGVLGFERRKLAQPAHLAEVIVAMQAVPGVEYVDVNIFDSISEGDAATPATLTERLDALAEPREAPRQLLPAAPARRAPGTAGILPAQLVYLRPDPADLVILTEVR